MDRLSLFKALLSQAIDKGFNDPFRKFAPDTTQGAYEEWLVSSGYYRAFFLNMLFTECIERYFLEDKKISLREDGEEMTTYMRRIIGANSDPLEFYREPFLRPAEPAQE